MVSSILTYGVEAVRCSVILWLQVYADLHHCFHSESGASDVKF